MSKRRRGARYYRPAEYFQAPTGDLAPPPILHGPFPTPEPFPPPPPEPAPPVPRPSTLARLTFDDIEETEDEGTPDEEDEDPADEGASTEPEALPADEVARMRKAAEAVALAGEHKVFLWTVPGPGTLAEALNRLNAEGRVTAEFREDAEGGYILYRPVLSRT